MMKANKVRLLIVGIFFAVYGVYYTIAPSVPNLWGADASKGMESIILPLIIGEAINLLVIATLILSIVASVKDKQNRWLYWAPFLIIGAGIVTLAIWPMNWYSDYGMTILVTLYGILMIVRALRGQYSQDKVKTPPPRDTVTP
ncbi:hypothetical protein [Schleiferilactobacillus shenzhenensis]|uniref:hypothetical protein n=1 Tax=Schleiferilactobacillus shenzhenensis TaxID=1231337 RepID=UPI0012DF68EE|nr:hypothetical protein [Schleiferilactobacillus shenzhenensis]